MDLTFGDAELAALCNSEKLMIRRWGRDGYRLVGRRLLELAAADMTEVDTLPGADLRFDPDGTVIIDFGRGTLVVRCALLNGDNGQPSDSVTSHEGLHILRIDIAQGSGAS